MDADQLLAFISYRNSKAKYEDDRNITVCPVKFCMVYTLSPKITFWGTCGLNRSIKGLSRIPFPNHHNAWQNAPWKKGLFPLWNPSNPRLTMTFRTPKKFPPKVSESCLPSLRKSGGVAPWSIECYERCAGQLLGQAMPEKHGKQVTLVGFHNGRVEYLQEIWLEYPWHNTACFWIHFNDMHIYYTYAEIDEHTKNTVWKMVHILSMYIGW